MARCASLTQRMSRAQEPRTATPPKSERESETDRNPPKAATKLHGKETDTGPKSIAGR